MEGLFTYKIKIEPKFGTWAYHTCRKYFAAGSKIGILAIFQFGFESFTIVKSTKIKDLEQISVCLVILQVQMWRTVALSTGMI